MSNFINNRIERSLGIDLNGDGYIGGQGLMSRLEHATHIDFNGDNLIGRRPDIYYGYQYPTYGYNSYGFGYSPYRYY
ncbi:unnamed protein product [Adineta ricciae]|uniref:EF-hand domain-containing protein n=1 Tax=Adineta ricciae TaxID=249248 RepID=A0A815VYZ5_ADIRI|nr:unnamed protein product [Adineta ricciae]